MCNHEIEIISKTPTFNAVCGPIKRTADNKTQKHAQKYILRTICGFSLPVWMSNVGNERSDKQIIEVPERSVVIYVEGVMLIYTQRNERIREALNIF